jgi:hypothetical protein
MIQPIIAVQRQFGVITKGKNPTSGEILRKEVAEPYGIDISAGPRTVCIPIQSSNGDDAAQASGTCHVQ